MGLSAVDGIGVTVYTVSELVLNALCTYTQTHTQKVLSWWHVIACRFICRFCRPHAVWVVVVSSGVDGVMALLCVSVFCLNVCVSVYSISLYVCYGWFGWLNSRWLIAEVQIFNDVDLNTRFMLFAFSKSFGLTGKCIYFSLYVPPIRLFPFYIMDFQAAIYLWIMITIKLS